MFQPPSLARARSCSIIRTKRARSSLQTFTTAHYVGTISGFGSGDGVILSDLTYLATATDVWDSVNGTLTVNDGTHTATISLAGTYQQDSFALEQNGTATEVVFSPTQVTLDHLTNNNAVEGQQITVLLSDQNLSNVSYTWIVGGQVVSGDTSANYTPGEADEGQSLVVLTNFTDPSTNQIEHITSFAGTVQGTAEYATVSDPNASAGTTTEDVPTVLSGLSVQPGDASANDAADSFTATLYVDNGTLA